MDTTYDDYSHTKYALALSKIEIHPDSAAAQLGYTAEDMVEILADQERWYREEYQPELEAETQHQQQHSNNGTPAPTTHIEPNWELYEGYGTVDKPSKTVASPDDDISDGGDPTWSQPPSPVLDAQPHTNCPIMMGMAQRATTVCTTTAR